MFVCGNLLTFALFYIALKILAGGSISVFRGIGYEQLKLSRLRPGGSY